MTNLLTADLPEARHFKFLFDRSVSDKRHYRHVHMGIDDMADVASSELNLRELRILHALLRERSITRTAELLATTQPGISKVLRHLRAQFGDPLFVRNGHAMPRPRRSKSRIRSVRYSVSPTVCAPRLPSSIPFDRTAPSACC
jgi:hypothetical protein